jgi:hypothetical protein
LNKENDGVPKKPSLWVISEEAAPEPSGLLSKDQKREAASTGAAAHKAASTEVKG